MQLWDIEENVDLAIKGCFQRDENGHEVWVLTAKRSWKYEGNSWVERRAESIYDAPVYIGKDGYSSLKMDSEFPVHKTNTDVIVYGKARAYAKRPVTYLECRLLIDQHIDKKIAIHGPRQWLEHGGSITISNPQYFIEQEIDYCHAIGGDERNRLGGGLAETNEELLKQHVPSVFYPNENWNAANNKTRVAGFGAIPHFFKERMRLAGTFDEEWESNRRPLLPCDFDMKYFQSAPLDQQCQGYLQGGERLMLSGFSHDDVLSFRIPSEKYLATAVFGVEEMIQEMQIYTVFIDAESCELSISYTAAFPCQSKEQTLKTSYVNKRDLA